jgi:hypothetical protein
MNRHNQRIALLLTISFLAQMLLGCASISKNNPDDSHTPGIIESPNPDYANAQATMDYGQSQLLDLSRKATDVSLNMSQAAHAAALSTQDANQHQKTDLDYQSTVISLNIAQAAATQDFVRQQTKIAGDTTAVAQNNEAIATQSANAVNVTRTAQAQASLDYKALQTHQAVAALTAYPLTATPYAVIQAALLMQEYDREQQSFVNQIVLPLIPILIIMDMLLIIVAIILAYYRYWKVYRRNSLHLTDGMVPSKTLIILDGVMAEHKPQLQRRNPLKLKPVSAPGLPGLITINVDIVEATEPPVAYWIAEVEHQLADDGMLLR